MATIDTLQTSLCLVMLSEAASWTLHSMVVRDVSHHKIDSTIFQGQNACNLSRICFKPKTCWNMQYACGQPAACLWGQETMILFTTMLQKKEDEVFCVGHRWNCCVCGIFTGHTEGMLVILTHHILQGIASLMSKVSKLTSLKEIKLVSDASGMIGMNFINSCLDPLQGMTELEDIEMDFLYDTVDLERWVSLP